MLYRERAWAALSDSPSFRRLRVNMTEQEGARGALPLVPAAPQPKPFSVQLAMLTNVLGYLRAVL